MQFRGRILVVGFSSGGHVASTLATHFEAGDPDATDPVERFSSRPDVVALLCPVVKSNHKEFFAGVTTRYFGTRTEREALVERDPELARELATIWGKPRATIDQ